jgi:hypothetical protein
MPRGPAGALIIGSGLRAYPQRWLDDQTDAARCEGEPPTCLASPSSASLDPDEVLGALAALGALPASRGADTRAITIGALGE